MQFTGDWMSRLLFVFEVVTMRVKVISQNVVAFCNQNLQAQILLVSHF